MITSSRLALTLLAAGALVSCGGGGGGGGGNKGPSLQVSPLTIVFSTQSISSTPASQLVTGTVKNYSGTLYVPIIQTNTGINTLAPPVLSGNSATAWVDPRSASSLGQGFYRDTITVFACTDPGCVGQLVGSPQVINVTYTVVLGTLPKVLNFTAVAGVRPDAQTVEFSIYDSSIAWASSYQFLDAVTNWLEYTPSSGTGGPITITVHPYAVPMGTAPGTYRANIIFGAMSGLLQFTLPINYTIQ